MNNNRTNNRRRGRGNNRQQGGGQQLNRIDSRARGNAPQLLEKYRKLAHDAHLNGDRVTEEYYLQFADHYFRVIADTRVRQEESRLRRDDRWQDGESERDDADDASEYGESDYPAYDQAQRDQAPRDQTPRETPRRERNERPREEPAPEERAAERPREAGERPAFEPAENPFLRESRGPRVAKPRREGAREERRPRRERSAPVNEGEEASDAAPAAFDPTILPPSIAPAPPIEAAEAEVPAKPKRRTRRTRAAEDSGDALQEVAG